MAQAARRTREGARESARETSPEEAPAVEALLGALAQQYGYDFRDYDRVALTRRIRKMLAREELTAIPALKERLLRSADVMRDFVELVELHDTAMFRDASFYQALRREVVPLLRTYPFVRIWHAGCATGEEVYSLAIILHEEGIYDRCRLYATDLSESLVGQAKRGIYPLNAMRGYTAAYQSAGGRESFSNYYVTDHKNAIIRQTLRKNIIFAQHNLISDAAFNEFHLVLARDVAKPFNQKLRERMHDLVYRSLIPFGLLGLGRKESLRFTTFSDLYHELPSQVRLYRKRR
jgi:chemotaxis protein methyltransferase CheR